MPQKKKKKNKTKQNKTNPKNNEMTIVTLPN